jgi:hypothetical protein
MMTGRAHKLVTLKEPRSQFGHSANSALRFPYLLSTVVGILPVR